jgi:hypothetical protein
VKPSARPPIYGLMAQFDSPERLIAGARAVHDAGYRRMDAYAPYPVEGLADALGRHHSRLPWIVLAGGICGMLGGYGLQYWSSVIAYPLNVGGRPLHSWPLFIPVTFELTVLVAAGSAVLGMLALNGLPMPYHPVFNLKSFERASRDGYFLCIESSDPRFSHLETMRFLCTLQAIEVAVVDH